MIDWTYSGNRLHPTQKPLPVLLPLIETFSAPDSLVLDPFAGLWFHFARRKVSGPTVSRHRARRWLPCHSQAKAWTTFSILPCERCSMSEQKRLYPRSYDCQIATVLAKRQDKVPK